MEAPHATGADGTVGETFQRHSRTVIARNAASMVTTWNESFASSCDDVAPFMGESTRNVCKEMEWFGPVQS